jgi:hypothetical protein
VDLWISRSHPGKQYLVSVGCLVVGLVLFVGFRDYRLAGGNAVAGFYLGMLLAAIGMASLLTTGKQSVLVDPQKRRITIEDARPMSTRKRVIAFSEILDINIGYLGKRSNFVGFYYLRLSLANGEEYPLFAPGRFFAGASDRAVVAGWQRRLQGYLDRPGLEKEKT